MKIVYCIFDCSSSGGTERALSLQANYFAGKGNEVHIVTTEKPSCKQNSYIFSDNISFHNLSINYREVDNSLSPLKIIYRIKKGHKHKQQLAKLLFALKPDFTIGMFGHDSSFLYKINDGSKKILEYHFSRYHRKIEFASAIFWKRWFALLREWRKCKFINKYDAFITALLFEEIDGGIKMIKFSRSNEKYGCFSNFYPCSVEYGGIVYPNSECAWQSLKTLDMEKRKKFATYKAAGANKMGRRVELRSDWEEVKYQLMVDVCYAKFSQNKELKSILQATGEEELIENTTAWHDNVWGNCECERCKETEGKNLLGKALMEVRSKLK